MSPCIFENFDERPRQDILVSDRSAIRYLIGKTDTLFRQNLMSARNFSDRAYAATGSPVARIVYLYAWNEWHEGGIVEPNVQSRWGTRLEYRDGRFSIAPRRLLTLSRPECLLRYILVFKLFWLLHSTTAQKTRYSATTSR